MATPTPATLDQGQTYRCGPFSVRAWFEGYGYVVTTTRAWAAAVALADSQQGMSFEQAHDFALDLATELDVPLRWLGDGYLRDFPTFDQAVRDGWCVVIGVLESDLNAAQRYYHFLDVDGLDGGDFTLDDSFSHYDGEDGHAPVADVHQAIKDNWDPVIVGLAFQLRPSLAQAISTPAPHMAPLEAILHELGAESYQIQPQNEHTVRIQVLVQAGLQAGGWPV